MTQHGYYRFPTTYGKTVVFVCEDDLWTVPTSGGVARRLTSGRGAASTPHFSPDGRWIAFISKEEGAPEVYVMPSSGGPAVRRTFLNSTLAQVVGWSRDGKSVLFSSDAGQAMMKIFKLFSVPHEGGLAEELPFGMARYASFGKKGVVLCRHGKDPAVWKRYRGGTVGRLWIDRTGRGRFERLIDTGGNVSNPMWIQNRIYFQGDHEGVANIYSCTPEGKGLKRHTKHTEYYVRNLTTDGKKVVYHAGGDLYVFDPGTNRTNTISVDLQSPRTQRNRKFVRPQDYFTSVHLSADGAATALIARGKPFTFYNWEGAVVQHGKEDGARYRLAQWLPDRKRIVAVTDESGEESLVVFHSDESKPPRHLGKLPMGRAVDMVVSPRGDEVVVSNHRFELIHVDLGKKRCRILDRSRHNRIAGMAWSPDGKWVAYGFQKSSHQGVIRLLEVRKGKRADVAPAVLQDFAPAFDPEGKYLYFLSLRVFNPVYDSMHFDLGFPRGVRPYLVTLRKDLASPFVPVPKRASPKPTQQKKSKKAPPLKMDLEGIQDRVVAFPVPEGRYAQIAGIKGGAIFTHFPVLGSLGDSWVPGHPHTKGVLDLYKFDDQKMETIIRGVSQFDLSADAKKMVYRSANRLRVIDAGTKPPEAQEKESPSRKSGWINLDRVRVSVDPGAEWGQMYDEAWRLMRDHFWVENMSRVDWKKVHKRYRPLIDRVATRSEFSDLVWETQGELGTSHCYEMLGDYRPGPRYDVGLLGADFTYDRAKKAYRITHIVRGDGWNEGASSPLMRPGVNLKVGDRIIAINGRRLSATCSPQEALVHQAGQEVTLTLQGGRSVNVLTLRTDYPARYREWVNHNRDWVHGKSKGRVGYVHIPDMGPAGFSEFHRQYLGEVDQEGLLIDVRYNGGGHVSQLLLEKLARKRLGYDLQRWAPPDPYPGDSPAGPMVALTNELAGSDGDIFSHAWKMYRLGPLVGRRTWGGVVGIWPRHPLVDGSVTTQPEFSFWFHDVGFGVENYGTEPDVDVDIAPQDYVSGKDPQMEKGLQILMDRLKSDPPRLPEFGPMPDLALPRLK